MWNLKEMQSFNVDVQGLSKPDYLWILTMKFLMIKGVEGYCLFDT